MKKKIVYSEPSDYFPEEIRKEYKLGEFSEKKDKNNEQSRDKNNEQSGDKK